MQLQVYTTYRYTFDRVYGPESTQQEVYEHSARGAVQQSLEVGTMLTIDQMQFGPIYLKEGSGS